MRVSFGCTAWISNGQDQRTADAGFRVASSMSYVTGSHNLKVGFSDSFGPVHVFTDRQADLVQTYNNTRPTSVTVYTTPYNRFSYVNYDLGIFAQDSWTIKRLTMNLGMRLDNFDSMIEATSMEAGRFAGERYFPAREHVPQWLWDVSPRLSAAYDLFGDGRTALKASFSRYLDPLTGGFADRYAPGAGNETRNWFDCGINAAGTACAGRTSLPTDGDDIAQANEIGPGGATFGIREDRDFDPEHPARAQHRDHLRRAASALLARVGDRAVLSPNVPGHGDARSRAHHTCRLHVVPGARSRPMWHEIPKWRRF